MQRFGTVIIAASLGLVLSCSSRKEKNVPARAEAHPEQTDKAQKARRGARRGAAPARMKKGDRPTIGYAGPIEKTTLANESFRQVLYTGKYSQLVVMSLKPGEEIGEEMHANIDQFFRIEKGNAKFVFGDKEERSLGDGDAIVVPAGSHHNVINASAEKPLKLYTIYSPPAHPDGTVHKTKAEAAAAEHH